MLQRLLHSKASALDNEMLLSGYVMVLSIFLNVVSGCLYVFVSFSLCYSRSEKAVSVSIGVDMHAWKRN